MNAWERFFYGCLAVAFIVILGGCGTVGGIAKCALLENTPNHCN
jgi:hypothetical protein